MKKELEDSGNSSEQRLIAQATAWVCGADRNNRAEFIQWILKSPQHVKAFLNVTAFYEELSKVLRSSPHPKVGRRRRTIVVASLAGVAAFAAAAMVLVLKPRVAVHEAAGPTIQFAGETLAEAAAKLNRYNAQKIVITDPALARQRISGRFPTNANEFATTLAVPSFEVQPVTDPRTGSIRLTRAPTRERVNP